MAAPDLWRHMRAGHPETRPAALMATEGRGSEPPRQRRCPGAGPEMCKCEHRAHALLSTAGMVYHIRAVHPAVRRAWMMERRGARRCTSIDARAHVRDACGIAYNRAGGLMWYRCRRRDENNPNGDTIKSSRLQCGDPPDHITGRRHLRCDGGRSLACRAQGLQGPWGAAAPLPPGAHPACA